MWVVERFKAFEKSLEGMSPREKVILVNVFVHTLNGKDQMNLLGSNAFFIWANRNVEFFQSMASQDRQNRLTGIRKSLNPSLYEHKGPDKNKSQAGLPKSAIDRTMNSC